MSFTLLGGSPSHSLQPTGTFTPELPTGRSPSLPSGMTTVATGQLPPAGPPPARASTSIAAPNRVWISPTVVARLCEADWPTTSFSSRTRWHGWRCSAPRRAKSEALDIGAGPPPTSDAQHSGEPPGEVDGLSRGSGWKRSSGISWQGLSPPAAESRSEATRRPWPSRTASSFASRSTGSPEGELFSWCCFAACRTWSPGRVYAGSAISGPVLHTRLALGSPARPRNPIQSRNQVRRLTCRGRPYQRRPPG